jgi:hypothetical protein
VDLISHIASNGPRPQAIFEIPGRNILQKKQFSRTFGSKKTFYVVLAPDPSSPILSAKTVLGDRPEWGGKRSFSGPLRGWDRDYFLCISTEENVRYVCYDILYVLFLYITNKGAVPGTGITCII